MADGAKDLVKLGLKSVASELPDFGVPIFDPLCMDPTMFLERHASVARERCDDEADRRNGAQP